MVRIMRHIKYKNIKNMLIKNWEKISAIIGIILSIISLVVSVILSIKSFKLEEKYNILSTYDCKLNYTIEISDKVEDGKIRFGNEQVNTGCINITPKVGGIEKVYLIQYYNDNVARIDCMELYAKGMESSYNAETEQYRIEEYFLDHVLNGTDQYLGTLFLVIKDYQNSYYTNMIVYEFDKNDLNKIQTRIYSDIDLLYLFNDEINLDVLEEYDVNQLMEYKTLREKINEILN